MKKFNIITIFPHIFESYFGESIIKRALEKKLVGINITNLRDFTADKHRTVDDTPFGGGVGMVMKVEPIYEAVKSLKSEVRNLKSETNLKTRVILFSAKGKKYTQSDAVRLSQYDNLILICGRYEGIDERVAENIADEEISIGDYVLTGGEIPAMVVVDSISRLIPGVLGNEESPRDESHSKDGYLEYPQYTRPEVFNDWKVPEVLLSGDHERIKKWRTENANQKNK